MLQFFKARQRWISALREATLALIDASAPAARGEQPARPKDDFGALKREVSALGLLRRRPNLYAAIVARTFSIAAVAWSALALARGSSLVWLTAPLLAFASGQLVLLAHDACHHAVFERREANDWLGLLAINLLNGGSYTWWTASHNEHHARSNYRGADPDIEYPMLAFDPAQADAKHPSFEPILARQHWLLPLLLTGVALNLRIYSAARLLSASVRWRERVAFVAHWVWYPALLVALLGPWRALAMMVLHQALFGVYIGAITMSNHWAMPMPEEGSLGFVEHQVSTSRNITGGALADLCFGGLNKQIEHHLFPSMPRVNLRRATPLVRAHCEAREIEYVERSFTEAVVEIYRAMRGVAQHVRRTQESRS